MRTSSFVSLIFLGAIAFFAIACQVLPKRESPQLAQLYAEMADEMEVGPTPQECVIEIFSDADAYDPSHHFTIERGSAPPYPEAIDWINESLTNCLNGAIDVD